MLTNYTTGPCCISYYMNSLSPVKFILSPGSHFLYARIPQKDVRSKGLHGALCYNGGMKNILEEGHG